MPYRPENAAQARIDDLFRQLGGQQVPLRVDWAKRLESIHAAIVLQQLMFEARQHADYEGWFYVTAEDMQDLTAVGERGYSAARGKLETLGLIETRKAGMPLRLYIRLLDRPLEAWIDEPRNKLRHKAEQGSTESGTSSDPNQDMDRSGAEPYIEDENLSTKVETKTVYISNSIDGMEAGSIWSAVLDDIESGGEIRESDLSGFVRPAKLLGSKPDGTLVLHATTAPAQRRIEAHLKTNIERAIGRWLGRPVKIEVTG